MHVGVAIGALRSDICEHKLGVAEPASYCLMSPPQRVASLNVGEVGGGPDRSPARGSVAILACDRERAMRVDRAPLLGLPVGETAA